jgi:cytochrome oxidase Cu insertion factor (SCO1/SenC/PrrC family)
MREAPPTTRAVAAALAATIGDPRPGAASAASTSPIASQPLALTDLVGHRVILSMAYTRCHNTCPATFNELLRMQQVLDGRGEQASFVIVGYDADNDDPRSWHDYRLNHRLDRPNWHFLAGSARNVRRLAHQLGFEFWNYDTHVMHDSRVVFFDSKGLFSGAVSPATGDWAALL